MMPNTGSLFMEMQDAVTTHDASKWNDPATLTRLSDERSAIESAVASGRNAYGFTSLLGPLDDIDASDGYQAQLLAGHLIGVPQEIDKRAGDWITATKLQQLSLGGSGITPKTFMSVSDSFAMGEIRYEIDLDASYSSADVVPASWWVRSVLGSPCHLGGDGDLIALMNGDFVSAGMLAYATERLLDEACVLFACLRHADMMAFPQTRGQELLATAMGLLHARNDHPQKSVLHRDCMPIVSGIATEIAGAMAVYENAASHRSGNPLFLRDDDGTVLPVSQSSFLDFSIASAASGLSHATCLSARLAQKAIASTCDRMEDGDRTPQWVQYPKVSLGYCIAIEGHQANAMQLTGFESGGVEDLWDAGLITTCVLLGQLHILDKETQLLSECFGMAGNEIVPMPQRQLETLCLADCLQ